MLLATEFAGYDEYRRRVRSRLVLFPVVTEWRD